MDNREIQKVSTVNQHPIYGVLDYDLGPKESVDDLIPPLDRDPLLIEMFRIAKKLAERRRLGKK